MRYDPANLTRNDAAVYLESYTYSAMSASVFEMLDHGQAKTDNITPSEAEVSELISSIKSASETAIDPALYYGSSVFDSTAMAALSSASEACTSLSHHHLSSSPHILAVNVPAQYADHLQGSSCASAFL